MSIGNPSKPLTALIAGPTASGKSAVALRLAERTGGVIINADSAQVYADLRVLSARPSAEEEARAEHRLYGFLDGAEACSAGRWAETAREEIARAHAARRLPILVGGTGLYIRTLLDGIAPVPDIPDDIRMTVRALPVAEAYRALTAEDSDAAARLNAGDSLRVARALEVVRGTGRPLSHWQATRSGGIGHQVTLAPLVLSPPRALLYARCDARLDTMIDDALAEVTTLLERNLDPALPIMRAIGVPEFSAAVRGNSSIEKAVAAAKMATRRYAKRQSTWFTNQSPVAWKHSEKTENDFYIDNIAIKFQS